MRKWKYILDSQSQMQVKLHLTCSDLQLHTYRGKNNLRKEESDVANGIILAIADKSLSETDGKPVQYYRSQWSYADTALRKARFSHCCPPLSKILLSFAIIPGNDSVPLITYLNLTRII